MYPPAPGGPLRRAPPASRGRAPAQMRCEPRSMRRLSRFEFRQLQERSSPTVDMKLKRIRQLLLAKVALLALWGCVSGCSPAANSNFIVPTVPATVQNSPPSILQSGGSSPSESRVVTQADSHLHALSFGGWACDFGYQQDGSRCVPVIVPENAQLSYFGNSWECMNGFQQDGSRCISVAVPEHGHLAYFGHSWECDSGCHSCAGIVSTVHPRPVIYASYLMATNGSIGVLFLRFASQIMDVSGSRSSSERL